MLYDAQEGHVSWVPRIESQTPQDKTFKMVSIPVEESKNTLNVSFREESRSQSNNLTVPRWLYFWHCVERTKRYIFDKWLYDCFFPLTCVHCWWQSWYKMTIIISSPGFEKEGFKCLSCEMYLSWVRKMPLSLAVLFFIILKWFVYCIIMFSNIILCLFLVKTQSLTKDYISSQKCEL